MKKTLIALAVLAASGAAVAQSNVTIYGAVDINYTKESDNSVYMGERYNNRLGFMGTEDLGGGLKATFQLEHRFTLNDGQATGGTRMMNGAANVGLAGASFGQVRFGRLNEISTETYRQIDPFQQYGVAGMLEKIYRGDNWDPVNGGGNGRLSSAARWDSPNWNGFKLMATYSVKNDGNGDQQPYDGGGNNGYAVGATYNNGPLYVVANYEKVKNSESSYAWNIGAAYTFGPARLSAGYEQTKDKIALAGNGEKQKNWIVGLSYTVGAGVINASYNQSEYLDGKAKKYGIGYTHNLSKRTSVYANYAHTKLTDYPTASFNTDGDFTGLGDAANGSGNAFEIGITHKF